jgi:hypothetical protein
MSQLRNSFNKRSSRMSEWSAVEFEAGLLETVRENKNGSLRQYITEVNARLRKSTQKEKQHYRMILREGAMLAQYLGHAYLSRTLGQVAAANGARGGLVRPNAGKSLKTLSEMLGAIETGNLLKTQQSYHSLPAMDQQDAADKGLALACRYGQSAAVSFFLEKGAKLQYDQQDILAWTAGEGRIDLLKKFEDKGKDAFDKNAALLATITGSGNKQDRFDAMRWLVEQGADIHTRRGLPLFLAVTGDQKDMADYLLAQGADLDTAYETGWADVKRSYERDSAAAKFAPYWEVYARKYQEDYDRLVGDKPDIDVLRGFVDEKSGMTGLGLAVRAGKLEQVLEHLCETGTKLDVHDIDRIGGAARNGLKLLERRDQFEAVFNAKLWMHNPKAVEELHGKLEDESQERISVKALQAEIRNRHMRNFVRNRKKPSR